MRRSGLSRAVERFNQRALYLTRPGPHWLLSSVKIGVAIKAAGILVSSIIMAGEHVLGYEAPSDRGSLGEQSLLYLAILALVLAPLLETLQIMLVHAATRRWLGLSGFVVASTLIAYGLHGPSSGIPVTAAFVFLIMSYQYVSFRDGVGLSRAFWGVAASHAVYNSMATLFVFGIRYFEA